FTYLADGRRRGADIRVVLGDGRLGVQRSADGAFDVIFMDAFNSDSVPVHLLTREAIDLYFRKLDEGGLLVINIANFYLDFRPILANLARDTGRLALLQEDQEDARIGKYASRWVVLARKQEDLGKLPSYQREASLQSVF